MLECNRFVNRWFTSNTYVLSHRDYDGVWVVDPGDTEPIYDWMKENGKCRIIGILLTHAHFDHIYGVNNILNIYPQCLIYTANVYGRELLLDAKKNASHYTELGPIVIFREDNIRYYTSDITLWPDIPVNVYFTPGHSDDSVCLRIENMLFTGDTLIKNNRTVTKLKGGSVVKLKESIEQIKAMIGQNLIVYAGHEESFLLDKYELTKSTNMNY